MQRFGEKIKELRSKKKLLQRHIAARLDIDTAMLSKIERGERKAKRTQVLILADIFQVNEEELLSLWLASKVFDVVKDEDVAVEALKKAELNVKHLKNSKK